MQIMEQSQNPHSPSVVLRYKGTFKVTTLLSTISSAHAKISLMERVGFSSSSNSKYLSKHWFTSSSPTFVALNRFEPSSPSLSWASTIVVRKFLITLQNLYWLCFSIFVNETLLLSCRSRWAPLQQMQKLKKNASVEPMSKFWV